MISGPITSWQIEGEKLEAVTDSLFLALKSLRWWLCHEIRRCLPPGRKATTILSVLKWKDITLLTNVPIVKAMVFPVVMYRYESWAIKKTEHWVIDAFDLWCWRRLESPLESKAIKPVNLKGNQPWILFGRTDAEVEAPILWPPDVNSWLFGKGTDAGKDWRQEEKGMTADEMVGWHHRLNGHDFEWTPGDAEGQGSLACCSPWGQEESDTSWWL